MHAGTATSFPANTITTCNFDTIDYDPNTICTTGASANMTAPVSGLYLVTAQILWTSAPASVKCAIGITVNGTDVGRGSSFTGDATGGDSGSSTAALLLVLNAGDVVKVFGDPTSTTSNTVSQAQFNTFAMCFIASV